jgi:hypothetical protein
MDMLKYPGWQKPYKAALEETDPQKLARLVREAEGAIFERIVTLSFNPAAHDEDQAIEEACQRLLIIKTEKLNSPWDRTFQAIPRL